MACKHVLRALLPAVAVLFGLAAPPGGAASIGTTENTQYLPVWLAAPGGAAAQPGPALLNMPPGWFAGDAAIVLAAGGDWPAGQRDRLVAALLDAGAAVLELNLPRSGPEAEETARAEIARALVTLRGTIGAGLVAAIGYGSGGAAALSAGGEAADPEGWRYAAVVRLGPGEPRFLRHDVPDAEAWPARAPLFCDVLATIQDVGASSVAAACHAALAR